MSSDAARWASLAGADVWAIGSIKHPAEVRRESTVARCIHRPTPAESKGRIQQRVAKRLPFTPSAVEGLGLIAVPFTPLGRCRKRLWVEEDLAAAPEEDHRAEAEHTQRDELADGNVVPGLERHPLRERRKVQVGEQ